MQQRKEQNINYRKTNQMKRGKNEGTYNNAKKSGFMQLEKKTNIMRGDIDKWDGK